MPITGRPTAQKRLGALAHCAKPPDSRPPLKESSRSGKNAAVAAPTSALEAATRRSAAATSGRRSSSCEEHAGGKVRRRELGGARRQGELRGGFAAQRGNRVLQLGTHHPKIDELGARRLQLRLRQGDIRIRCDAGRESLCGDVECRLIGNDGLLQQVSVRVQPAQIEIIHREFGMHAQLNRCQIGCARLGPRLGAFDCMADLAE